MAPSELVFTREFELSPAIVWDALVDPILLEGWLGAVAIDPVPGGAVRIEWLSGGDFAPAVGRVTEIVERQRLAIETDTSGELTFVLDELDRSDDADAGAPNRMTSVTVRLAVATDPRMTASTIAHWRNNLDQLGELLHGHPVDWGNWAATRGPVWEGYLGEAQRTVRGATG